MQGCQRGPSPTELARQALEAASPEEQELAAVELADAANNSQLQPQLRQQAKQQLRRVLTESQSPPVRAACIQGVASQWDYEGMPALLDALDDESKLVRRRAGMAVERMMSKDLSKFNYNPDDPAGKRAPAIKVIREVWEKDRDSPIMKRWRQRLKKKSDS